jgi:L,D-peptidoglycan transpeptidase YkuD (ErfK/YbiS/YcfS/YnhG family)
VAAQSTAPSGQLITVQGSSYRNTHAMVTAWTWRGGRWRRVLGPWPGRIGYSGFSTMGIGKRRQNSGTTPVGVFTLTQAFGIQPNPGTAMPWHQVTKRSWWPYDPSDPATYNLLQSRRTAAARWSTSPTWSEHLIDYRSQYAYSVVINFNTPASSYVEGGLALTRTPVDTSAGGGIFLHVNGLGPTAGCVSVSSSRMKKLLRWLRPNRSPRIAMGPASVLSALNQPRI